MRLCALFALAACGPTEGSWLGDTTVEISRRPIDVIIDVDLSKGTTQLGDPELDVWGHVTHDQTRYEVEGHAPWGGHHVLVELVPVPSYQTFGVGGGEVRVDLTFELDGRVRGRRMSGRVVVAQFNDLWGENITLERSE